MADLPPITQEFRADVSHFRKTCEVIALHVGNLARDLATLEGDCDHVGGGANGMCGKCGQVIYPDA